MSDELFALLTEHKHDNMQLFKDWARENFRRNQAKASMFDNTCRCDGVRMEGSDHCPECGCEEFEERCEWTSKR